MKKFLHFTGWKTAELNYSTEYATHSWEISNYWSNKLKGSFVNEVNFFPGPLGLLRDASFAEINLGELLTPHFRQLKYSSELLKEYIFEEIRAKKYPKLPVRTRCMFLFGDNCDPDAYAKGIGFKSDNYNLVEVMPSPESSNIHMGDYRLLDCNTGNYELIAGNAEKYWDGCKEVNNFTEILFEGKFCVSPRIMRF